MERRTIITIVLLVASGIIFLVVYNRDKNQDEDQAAEANSAPDQSQTERRGKTFQVPNDGQAGFSARISAVGGSLASVVLHDPQYRQGDRTEDAPDYVPRDRLAPGPLEVVGTWDRDYYPFGLTVTALDWRGNGGKIERLIRKDAGLTPGEGGGVVTLSAPKEGDLTVRVGDLLQGEGMSEPLKIVEVSARGAIQVAGALPNPLPTTVNVVRRGSPLEQYRADATYTEVKTQEGEISVVWPNPERDESDVWIQRTWGVKDLYRLKHRTQVFNLGSTPLEVHYVVDAHGWVDPWAEEPGMFSPPVSRWMPGCYVDGDLESETLNDLLEEEGSRLGFTGKVKWFGLTSQYFLLVGVFPSESGISGSCALSAYGNGVINASFGRQTKELLPGAGAACLPEWFPRGRRTPDVRCSEAMAKVGVDEEHLDEASVTLALERFKGSREEALALRKMLLTYGGARALGSMEMTVLAGPKELGLLDDTDETLETTLDFWFVGFLAKPLLGFLKTIHAWVGVWWVAILLLTVLIKLLMLPLTQKSYEQMQRMQQLSPEMKDLQKKYANDRQRQQQEMMNLYKRHKVNPLGGCLPMLLQMPVYLALYRCIYSAVDLYQAPLFAWINDMTQPDPYYVLPVLLGVFMFVQQMFMPTSPGADPMQQKIIKYAMPAMFSLFMLMLPAGLVFYIFVSTVIGIAQQYYIKRKFNVSVPRRAEA